MVRLVGGETNWETAAPKSEKAIATVGKNMIEGRFLSKDERESERACLYDFTYILRGLDNIVECSKDSTGGPCSCEGMYLSFCTNDQLLRRQSP